LHRLIGLATGKTVRLGVPGNTGGISPRQEGVGRGSEKIGHDPHTRNNGQESEEKNGKTLRCVVKRQGGLCLRKNAVRREKIVNGGEHIKRLVWVERSTQTNLRADGEMGRSKGFEEKSLQHWIGSKRD